MKKRCFPAALLALLLLLPGCTAEDRERTRENDRISALAQRDAARLALEYVEEKYGFEAAVLGYDVDGSDVFMAYRAYPLVTVALTDGEKEFLVYLGLEAPEVRWDNYQRGEVAACLESWLLDGLALGEPCAADLIFRAAEDPSPGQAHINGFLELLFRPQRDGLVFQVVVQRGVDFLSGHDIISFVKWSDICQGRTKGPGAAEDAPAVRLAACLPRRGVALDSGSGAARRMLHDAGMSETVDRDISRPWLGDDPLPLIGLIPTQQCGAACRPAGQGRPRLLEAPLDKNHAPGYAVPAVPLAVFGPVAPCGAFLGA